LVVATATRADLTAVINHDHRCGLRIRARHSVDPFDNALQPLWVESLSQFISLHATMVVRLSVFPIFT
jgi:hypothetical protein